MDSSERMVEQYLRARGFSDVVHEPDGQMPPDFLVDGCIAVEVRRLNQHEVTDDRPRGLEHVAARIEAVVEGVLDSLGPPDSGPTWFVVCEYRRPVPGWKDLRRDLRAVLADFAEVSEAQSPRIDVLPNFAIWLIRTETLYPKRFLPSAFLDHDRGGAVLSEMRRNLAICLVEKSRKIASCRARYPKWWLVLVDYIGHELLDTERAQLRSLITVEAPGTSSCSLILLTPSRASSSRASDSLRPKTHSVACLQAPKLLPVQEQLRKIVEEAEEKQERSQQSRDELVDRQIAFMDESGILGGTAQRFFCLGFMKMRACGEFSDSAHRIYDRAISSVPGAGPGFEFKFNAVTSSSLPFHLELIDAYFAPPECRAPGCCGGPGAR